MSFDLRNNTIESAGDINSHNTLVQLSISPRIKPPKKPVLRACPSPSSTFIGRRDILDQLHRFYFDQRRTRGARALYILHGPGGSGKTQIAQKFVEECEQADEKRFERIFFIDASSISTLEADFVAIAATAGVGDTTEDALRWLASSAIHWLLIIDNADDPSIPIRNFIPRLGNTLITTRNRGLCSLAPNSNTSVGNLTETEAEELFLQYVNAASGPELQAVKDIVKEVHYFPLAVVQAAAYNALSGTLMEYIGMYRNQRDILLAQYEDIESYSFSVYATWNLSFVRLHPAAKRFLQLCSFLHHTGIPKDLFQRASETKLASPAPDIQNFVQSFLDSFSRSGKWDHHCYQTVLNDIQRHSLLDIDIKNASIGFHPLVHNWARTTIGDLEQPLVRDSCLALVAFSVPEDQHNHISYLRKLQPHLQSYTDAMNIVGIKGVQRVCSLLHTLGCWAAAEELELVVTETSKETLGSEHPDTLLAMGNLGLIYGRQGKWQKAEELGILVVEVMKKTLGAEHPDTLAVMSNLSSTYKSQGNWKKAEELQLAVMEVTKRKLGHEHPDTLTATGTLAAIYRIQGRWKEAEKLLVMVMDTSNRTFGPEHPSTLSAMRSLGMTYGNQGKWQKAKEIHLAAMQASERTLGPEHPDTLTAKGNLALAYGNQGQWEEAEELQLTVVEAMKRTLGADHPDTLIALGNLGSTYGNQGNWQKAEELLLFVAEGRQRILGSKHPSTLNAMRLLGSIYGNQGKWQKAEELELVVVEAMKNTLGAEHPNTLHAIGILGLIYGNQREWQKAEDQQLVAMQGSQSVLGPEHPDTLAAARNLAVTYGHQGKWKEAEELLVVVAETMRRMLGPEHQDTLTAMGNLAVAYRNQGKWKEESQCYEHLPLSSLVSSYHHHT